MIKQSMSNRHKPVYLVTSLVCCWLVSSVIKNSSISYFQLNLKNLYEITLSTWCLTYIMQNIYIYIKLYHIYIIFWARFSRWNRCRQASPRIPMGLRQTCKNGTRTSVAYVNFILPNGVKSLDTVFYTKLMSLPYILRKYAGQLCCITYVNSTSCQDQYQYIYIYFFIFAS